MGKKKKVKVTQRIQNIAQRVQDIEVRLIAIEEAIISCNTHLVMMITHINHMCFPNGTRYETIQRERMESPLWNEMYNAEKEKIENEVEHLTGGCNR